MQRPLIALGVIVTLCFFLGGCGDTHDSITQEMLAKFNELNTVLDGVKDEDSAKAAAPKVEAISTQLKEIQTRGSKLGKPSDTDQKAMRDKYEKQMQEAVGKLMQNAARIQMQPDLRKHLDAAMSKMPNSM